MGIYYQIACDEKKERIDPGDINNLGIKQGAIAHPKHPFGSVAVFAMLRYWGGSTVRLVNDCGEDPGYFDYKNITREVVEAYNVYYSTTLTFTGRPMEDDTDDGSI